MTTVSMTNVGMTTVSMTTDVVPFLYLGILAMAGRQMKGSNPNHPTQELPVFPVSFVAIIFSLPFFIHLVTVLSCTGGELSDVSPSTPLVWRAGGGDKK